MKFSWSLLLCLVVVGGTTQEAESCEAAACEEHSPGHGDGDCCAIPSDAYCSEGYVYSEGEFGCGRGYTHGAVTTCCTLSGPSASPSIAGLRKVEVGRVMSWYEYRARAQQEGGRLPTTAELRAAGVDVGFDQWTPITATDADHQTGRRDGTRGRFENAWANIGPRKYQIEYPAWGLDASTHPWKRLTYFYVSGVDAHRICDDSKCSSNGNDCCAPNSLQEAATCRDGFTPHRTGVGCYGYAEGTYECCEGTQACEPAACEEHSPGQHDEDCCAMPSSAYCSEGYVYSEGEFGCGQGHTFGVVTTCCTLSGPSSSCASGYSLAPDGRRCYKAVTTTKTWGEARAACQADAQGYGTDLATITSSGENAFVTGLIAASSFIGATDADAEGTWKWAGEGGGAVTYTNWQSGEPNQWGGNEDCANLFTNGKWNDEACTSSIGFVCSHRAVAEESPSAEESSSELQEENDGGAVVAVGIVLGLAFVGICAGVYLYKRNAGKADAAKIYSATDSTVESPAAQPAATRTIVVATGGARRSYSSPSQRAAQAMSQQQQQRLHDRVVAAKREAIRFKEEYKAMQRTAERAEGDGYAHKAEKLMKRLRDKKAAYRQAKERYERLLQQEQQPQQHQPSPAPQQQQQQIQQQQQRRACEDPNEKRVAPDGGEFTKAEFIAYYGGVAEWDAAPPVQPPSTPAQPAAPVARAEAVHVPVAEAVAAASSPHSAFAFCTSCGARGPANAKFCSECGARRARACCTGCGGALQPNTKFCPECGTKA